jgi:hypothetical protein
VVLGERLHQVGEPVGQGVDLVLNRLVGPLRLFYSSATSRNATIVVTVLMINCQVSTSGSRRNDGARIGTSSTQSTKNHARDPKVAHLRGLVLHHLRAPHLIPRQN